MGVVTYLDNFAAIPSATRHRSALGEPSITHQPSDGPKDTPVNASPTTSVKPSSALTAKAVALAADHEAHALQPLSSTSQKRLQSWVQRGYALEEMGYYEEAITSFERAIVLDARCVDAWQGRGIALAKLGYHEEALMSFGRVTRWNANDYRAWQNMGRVLMSLERHAEALSHFDRVLLLKADSYKAWYHRAIALDAQNKPMAALSSLDRALKIRPECHYAWTAQGMLLGKLGRYPDAEASFDCSLRLRGNNFGAWYGKASFAAIQGLVEPALENLIEAKKCSPFSVRSMLKTDRRFDPIRFTLEFQRFIQGNGEGENIDVLNSWMR
ncbi:tetratricopeptide repeat protein [Romeriopsis navalis]|uniref:tetratricopeptide repeat protein n=1 Tax=Romeriopsis navalis TaxID=2992132 RepID=UPI0021F8DCAF|nr:tetratricopeptide repeat protein [Romeriopsis navalis]